MLRCYSVYDQEKERYSNPFYTMATYPDYDKKDLEAIRIFKTQLFDRHNMIALFPDLFSLCYLGDFDEVEGKFEMCDPDPYVVITGEEAIKELNNHESKEN